MQPRKNLRDIDIRRLKVARSRRSSPRNDSSEDLFVISISVTPKITDLKESVIVSLFRRYISSQIHPMPRLPKFGKKSGHSTQLSSYQSLSPLDDIARNGLLIMPSIGHQSLA